VRAVQEEGSMSWFFHSTALPGSLAAIALILALWTGKVMDLRRSSYSSSRLWLSKSESPTYYWMCVVILGFLVALCASDAVMR
jgi:cell division protein FtsX